MLFKDLQKEKTEKTKSFSVGYPKRLDLTESELEAEEWWEHFLELKLNCDSAQKIKHQIRKVTKQGAYLKAKLRKGIPGNECHYLGLKRGTECFVVDPKYLFHMDESAQKILKKGLSLPNTYLVEVKNWLFILPKNYLNFKKNNRDPTFMEEI